MKNRTSQDATRINHLARRDVAVAADTSEADRMIAVCGALLPAHELKDAAERLLPALLGFDETMMRAVLFGADGAKGLAPLAARERSGVGGSYSISKDMLRQCVKDGQALVRDVELKHVIVLPVSTQAGAALVLHAELDVENAAGCAVRAERLEKILRLVAPKLEALTSYARLNGWVSGLMMTINAALAAKDTYTGGHSQRVARYALAIGRARGLSHEETEALHLSALCHDIGKIGVPDQILKKPGLLSAEEFQEMKAHPLIGDKLISGAPNAAAIASGVRYHHERWDGTGYPEGLAGAKIPQIARIIAVADSFDAMTSGRAYTGFVSQDDAVQMLSAKTDLFDPEILGQLVKAYDEGSLDMRTGTVVAAV